MLYRRKGSWRHQMNRQRPSLTSKNWYCKDRALGAWCCRFGTHLRNSRILRACTEIFWSISSRRTKMKNWFWNKYSLTWTEPSAHSTWISSKPMLALETINSTICWRSMPWFWTRLLAIPKAWILSRLWFYYMCQMKFLLARFSPKYCRKITGRGSSSPPRRNFSTWAKKSPIEFKSKFLCYSSISMKTTFAWRYCCQAHLWLSSPILCRLWNQPTFWICSCLMENSLSLI